MLLEFDYYFLLIYNINNEVEMKTMTIGVPVFNSHTTIERALLSVVSQFKKEDIKTLV